MAMHAVPLWSRGQQSYSADDVGGQRRAGARTLAETVIRTRCAGCGEPPAKIYLAADGCGPDVVGGASGWTILLHAELDGAEVF